MVQGCQSRSGVVSVIDLSAKMHEEFERKLWKQGGEMMNFAFDPTPLPEFCKDFQNTIALLARVGGGEFIPFNEEKRLMR